MTTIEHDDHYELPVNDCTVTGLVLDRAVTLQITSAEESYAIRIEQPFTLTTGTGEQITVRPEGPTHDLAPSLTLLRLPVVRVHAFKNGHLEAYFGSKTAIKVESSDNYEPWEITTKDGDRLVSTPRTRLGCLAGGRGARRQGHPNHLRPHDQRLHI
ncbi:MAG TPA: DUF6188 family protein [Streptosporangiaceae bacterium]